MEMNFFFACCLALNMRVGCLQVIVCVYNPKPWMKCYCYAFAFFVFMMAFAFLWKLKALALVKWEFFFPKKKTNFHTIKLFGRIRMLGFLTSCLSKSKSNVIMWRSDLVNNLCKLKMLYEILGHSSRKESLIRRQIAFHRPKWNK